MKKEIDPRGSRHVDFLPLESSYVMTHTWRMKPAPKKYNVKEVIRRNLVVELILVVAGVWDVSAGDEVVNGLESLELYLPLP